ncbi:MAG: ATP-binding cassette domain-containing protein [Gordonia sp. (in: high G+C Gram-positive bacteria)]|uniref:ABC transporter ATP-binding protein n=1 Tax=Gordonia sp. (in: high G+C Gram-positive bacteria) TaxID=84139 RepID=UPI0039E6AE8E
MTLHAASVSWRAGESLIVDGVDLTPAPGATVGLLGPNGSGKSTLLTLLAGIRRPTAGIVTLDDVPLEKLRRRDVARRVAQVEQHSDTEVDLRVADVVALGRTPHRGVWGGETDDDRSAIAAAVARTDLHDLLDRSWRTLSGGERQRVQIARALAQEPRELLLDEPTNHLDISHQLDLLALVRRLPTTTVVALHDLNLAAMFCDAVVVLDRGRVVAAGTPAEVLTADLIARVYRVRAEVRLRDGRPTILFLPPETSGTPSAP